MTKSKQRTAPTIPLPKQPGEGDQFTIRAELPHGNGKPEPSTEQEPAAVAIEPPEPQAAIVSVNVPLWPDEGKYCQEHVQCQLSPAQALVLRRLMDALDKRDSRTADGRHVGQSGSRAVMWLLEAIGTAITGR